MKTLHWHEISDTINARSGRERLYITCTFLLVFYVIAMYTVQPTLDAQQIKASNEIQLIQALIKGLNQSIHQSVSDRNQFSSAESLKKIAYLSNEISQFSTKLNDISNRFVSANEMIGLIKAILNKQNLQLLYLENTPPEAITENKENAENIYKHGINLEISGSYHNHIIFLDTLKKLPWGIFWERLHLQAGDPGQTIVNLSIYTLNHSSVWLEL